MSVFKILSVFYVADFFCPAAMLSTCVENR